MTPLTPNTVYYYQIESAYAIGGATYYSPIYTATPIGNFSINSVTPFTSRILKINVASYPTGVISAQVCYQLPFQFGLSLAPTCVTQDAYNRAITPDASGNIYINISNFYFETTYYFTLSVSNNYFTVSSPQYVGRTPAKLSSDYANGCYVNSLNNLYCWGANGGGQLYPSADYNNPIGYPVYMSLVNDAISVTVGYSIICYLDTNSEVYCAGSKDNGIMGDTSNSGNSFAFPDIMVQTSSGNALTGVTQFRIGRDFACGISAGTPYCWGTNDYGQLDRSGGVSASQFYATAIKDAGGLSYVVVQTGYYHACALSTSNTVICWGDNNDGQTGSSNTGANTTTAVSVTDSTGTTITDFVNLSVGAFQGCGVRSSYNYSVWCWGLNSAGQGGSTSGQPYFATQVPTLTNVISIAAGGEGNCAIVQGGQLYCWGGNVNGGLGTSSYLGSYTSTPVQVMAPPNSGLTYLTQIAPAMNIATGNYGATFCSQLQDNSIWCWGENGAYEAGAPGAESISSTSTSSLFSDLYFLFNGFRYLDA
jgi:hypothetical protein